MTKYPKKRPYLAFRYCQLGKVSILFISMAFYAI